MPIFYKRKQGFAQGEWAEVALKNAVIAVEIDEMSVKSTSSVLGMENQKKLIQHIKKLQRNGFGSRADYAFLTNVESQTEISKPDSSPDSHTTQVGNS